MLTLLRYSILWATVGIATLPQDQDYDTMVVQKHDELKACKFKAQYHSQVFRDKREIPPELSDPDTREWVLAGWSFSPEQPRHALWPSLWKWKWQPPTSWWAEAEAQLKLQEELKPLEAGRFDLSNSLAPLRRFAARLDRHSRQFLRQLFTSPVVVLVLGLGFGFGLPAGFGLTPRHFWTTSLSPLWR